LAATLAGSAGSWPAMTSSSSAQSSTVQHIGPQWSSVFASGMTPARLTSP
jgi:hypothetical protein